MTYYDSCDRCLRRGNYTVRCGHGIACVTYLVCGTHLSWAVREVLSEDPSSSGVRVDIEEKADA